MCNVNTVCFDCSRASCPTVKQIFSLIRQSLLQVAPSPRTCPGRAPPPAPRHVSVCAEREKAHESIWNAPAKKSSLNKREHLLLSDCVILFIYKNTFYFTQTRVQTRRPFLSFSFLRPPFANLSPLGGTVNAPLAVLIVGGAIIFPVP